MNYKAPHERNEVSYLAATISIALGICIGMVFANLLTLLILKAYIQEMMKR